MDTQKELNSLSTALSDIAAAVSPSVVNVSTTRNVAEQRLPFNDLHDHPFFRKFFGQPYSPDDEHNTYKTSSLGSGVIVSSNGHILTNNHVIENAEKITITLHDKRTFDADLVGTDPKTDLALLKIDALNLPALAFNEESDLQVGEIVVAVGIPFGLSHTVTMGIVSAVGRSNIGIVDYEDFIQTDAAINPGNSGGALVNSGGELIGINTAIFSTSGGNMGVGFAIPVKMAKGVMDSLLEHGKVVRGWLGVNIQAVTPELMEYFDLERKNGALISEVADKSPAAKAGLQQGDIVVVFNETKIDDPTDLKNIAAATAPGSTVNITVIRGGDRKNLEVTLGEYPQDGQNQTSTTNGKFYGAHLQDLTPELKRQLDIPIMINGVLVVHLDSGSPAAEVLQQNDVIIQIDRKTVSSKSELLSARKTLEQKDTILLLVHRNGRSIFLTLAP
jgi:serine protease Do